VAPVQLLLLPEVKRPVTELLLVTQAVVPLDGLQMQLVPVVLHRHFRTLQNPVSP
jgi:hypothetical protein